MDSIGGYRIIRRLGSGERADVLLGHAAQGQDVPPRLAALKVFHPQVTDASIDAEISTLSRVEHPHVVKLLDLATGPGNRAILILQRLEPGGLARLLADRGALEPGEAVTILAPVVAAVMALHREGFTHGGVGASAVLFDETGAPVLCGFGASRRIAEGGTGPLAPAVLDQDAGVVADIRALIALAGAVLARVPGPSATELVRWLASQPPNADLPARLEHRLFAFEEPTPVSFGAETQPAPIPHRLGVAGVQAVDAPAAAGRTSIVPWLEAQVLRAPDGLRNRIGGIRTAVRGVRRRVWIVAGAGLAAAVLSFVMVQAPQPSPQSDPPPTPAATAAVDEVVSSSGEGDDPVAAARSLLRLRDRCLLERSILCLDGVHQAGSAAWQADSATIQRVQDGGELERNAFLPDAVTLIDRMGDSALVGIHVDGTPPEKATASVLLIRTEAGWRVRGLLAAPDPTGG